MFLHSSFPAARCPPPRADMMAPIRRRVFPPLRGRERRRGRGRRSRADRRPRRGSPELRRCCRRPAADEWPRWHRAARHQNRNCWPLDFLRRSQRGPTESSNSWRLLHRYSGHAGMTEPETTMEKTGNYAIGGRARGTNCAAPIPTNYDQGSAAPRSGAGYEFSRGLRVPAR